jgi:uncharacterized protein YjbI with pentapeptide repeats
MLNSSIIGHRIAEARKKKNISQAGLAGQLFISSQAVGKWERGESMPDIITFNRIAEILDVDLNYFSESFQSVVTETETGEPPIKQFPEVFQEHEKKKPGWDMSNGNWNGADFSGLKNLNEKFSSSNLQNCLFIASDLSELSLVGNNIENCDFSESDLNCSHFQSSILASNKFRNCSLKEAQFSTSQIKGCDFSNADFTDAIVKSCDFLKNTMAGAIWNRSSFHNIHFADIEFDGVWNDCSFDNCEFTRLTFRNATFVSTFFKAKSLKRIRFIECKADKLTYAFLKNGKADLSDVTLITT